MAFVFDDEQPQSVAQAPKSTFIFDDPQTDEEKFAKLNKDLEDRAMVGQRAYEGMTDLGNKSKAYDARYQDLSKGLEDQAMVGQRALDENLALGESSRKYDEEHPGVLKNTLRRVTNAAKFIPYGAVKALQGATAPLAPIWAPLGTPQAMEEAAQYWKPNTDINIPDIGVGFENGRPVARYQPQKLEDLFGAVAESAGGIAGPVPLAMKAGRLVMGQSTMGPAAQRVASGVVGGALLGEGDPQKTLESAAMFGLFEAMPTLAGKVKDSPWYRGMTIKERGLVTQSLDDMLKRGYSEGDILRNWNNPTYRADALARRMQPETAVEPGTIQPEMAGIKAGVSPVPGPIPLELSGEGALPAPGAFRTNVLPPDATTIPVSPPAPGQTPGAGPALPSEAVAKPLPPVPRGTFTFDDGLPDKAIQNLAPSTTPPPASGAPGALPVGPGAAPQRPGTVPPPAVPGQPNPSRAMGENEVYKFPNAQAAADYITARRMQKDDTIFDKTVDPQTGEVVVRNNNWLRRDPTPRTLPPEPPVIPDTRPTGAAVIQNPTEFPVRRVPISKIEANPKELQFKLDVNASGEQKPLAGEWNDLASGNLLLWQDKGGKFFVANGHHRLAHAKRLGVDEVNAQVLKEADGFSVTDARRVAAESNILEGKGTIYDQAEYFRTQPEYTPDVARKRGVETKGYAIGKLATGNTYDLFRDRKIKPEVAVEISTAAPGNESLQAVGVKFSLAHPRADTGEVTHFIKAIELQRAPQTKGEQVDLFGFDDAAIRSAEQAAKKATKIIKDLREDLNAISGASRRPERAKKLGVDVNKPGEVAARADQLKAEIGSWEKWYNDPAKIALVEKAGEMTVKEPRWEFGGRIPFGAVEVVQPGDIKRQKADQADQGSLFGPEPGKEAVTKKKGPEVEQLGMFDRSKAEPAKVPEPKREAMPEPSKKETAGIPADPKWSVPGSGRPVKGEMVWENRFSKGAFGTMDGPMEKSPERAVDALAERKLQSKKNALVGEKIAAATKKAKAGDYTDEDIKTLTGRGLLSSTGGIEGILRSLGLNSTEARKIIRNSPDVTTTKMGTVLYSVRDAIEYARKKGLIGEKASETIPEKPKEQLSIPGKGEKQLTLFEKQKAYASLKAEAEKYGVTYKGPWMDGDKILFHNFTDNLTHGDFGVKPGEDVKAALLKMRKPFVEAGNIPASALNVAEPKKEYRPPGEFKALHAELLKQKGLQYDLFPPREKQLTLEALADLRKVEKLPIKGREGSGIRTLGHALSDEMVRKGFVNFEGREVGGLDDFIPLAQVLRNPKFETHYFWGMKRMPNGRKRVQGYYATSSKVPGSTNVVPGKPAGYVKELYRLRERIKRWGADEVYSLHNHPSGKVRFSREDGGLNEFFAKALPDVYQGMLTIDHEKYGQLLPWDGADISKVVEHDLGTGKADPFLKPSIDHPAIGMQTLSPQDVAEAFKTLRMQEGRTVLFFMNAELKINGVHDIPNGIAKRKDFVGYLRNRGREFGAQRSIIITGDVGLRPVLSELYGKGYIHDGIIVVGDEAESLRNIVPPTQEGDGPWLGKTTDSFNVASPVVAYGQADPRHIVLNDKLTAQRKDLAKLQRERDNLEAKVNRLDKHIGTLKTEQAKKINTELRRRAKLQRVDREKKVMDLIDKIHDTERAVSRLEVGGEQTIVKRRQMGEKKENRFAPPVTQKEFDVVKEMVAKPPMKGALREWFETAPRMWDHYGQKAKELFYRPATAARFEAHKETIEVFKQIDQQFKKLPHKSPRRIGIYAIAQQPNGTRLLKEAGIEKVPTLTPEEMQTYRWSRDLLNQTYERLQAARKVAGQKPFPAVQDYFTFMRNLSFWDRWGLNPATADLNLLPEYEVHLRSTPFRFAKKRVKASYPVEIDAKFILKNYMKSALTHIHMGPEIAKMRELVGRFVLPSGKEFLMRDENPTAYHQITQWVDFISGTSPPTSLPEIVQKSIKALSRNIVASTLSFSVRSALIQPTSLLQTWARLGTRPMLQAVPSMFHPSEWRRALEQSHHLSPRIMDIALDRAVEELWGPVTRTKAKAVGAGFYALRALDYASANYTWLAAEAAGKKAGLSGAELINFADDITVSTQGSGAREDISRIQRTVLGHAAMLFQTFNINQWGFFLRDTLGMKSADALPKREILRRLLYFLVGVTAINTLYEDILGMPSPLPTPINSYLRAKDEGKTTSQALLQGAYSLVGMIPSMGGLRFGSTMMGAAADWTMDVAKKGAEWGGQKGQYVKPAPEIAMRGLGIPGTSQIYKTVRGLDKDQSLPEALVGTTKSSLPGKARVRRPAPGVVTEFLGIRSPRKAARRRANW